MMFIDKNINNGKEYLRLVEATRVTGKNGYKITKKRVILNLGPLDRYDDGKPDYLERLRQSFRDGAPLIPELRPYCGKPAPRKYTFTIEDGSPDCVFHVSLVSPLLLERILEELGLESLFASRRNAAGLSYDVYGFARLMITDRVLHPGSGDGALRRNGDYYEPPLEEGYDPDSVYDTLDFICENRDRILRRMNTSLVKKAHRRADVIFCGVTNFSLDVPAPEPAGDFLWWDDEDTPEGPHFPAARVGLFLDSAGLPVSLEELPGKTPDYLAAEAALRAGMGETENARLVYVAGSGACSDRKLLSVRDAGLGYIVSGSLGKCSDEERAWALGGGDEDTGTGLRVKSRVAERTYTDSKGNCRSCEEKVVVFRRGKTGDKDQGAGGYRQLISSELDMDPLEIIEMYESVRQAESQLRAMKGTPETDGPRSRPEHFRAHLTVCLTALLVTRILQKRVADHEKAGTPGADRPGPPGMPAEKIQAALGKWKVSTMPDDLFRLVAADDPDLERILDAFGIDLPRKLYSRADIKRFKTGTEIFP